MTKFQILARDASGYWREGGTEEAHNATDAVKKAYLSEPNAEIVAMVAVPARSWKPTPIRTETVERVVLGDVAPASQPEGAGATPEGTA